MIKIMKIKNRKDEENLLEWLNRGWELKHVCGLGMIDHWLKDPEFIYLAVLELFESEEEEQNIEIVKTEAPVKPLTINDPCPLCKRKSLVKNPKSNELQCFYCGNIPPQYWRKK